MPRKPLGHEPKSARLELRLTRRDLDMIDQMRGSISRAQYLLGLVYSDLELEELEVPDPNAIDHPFDVRAASGVGPEARTPPKPAKKQPSSAPPEHRFHRRGKVVDTRFVQGARQTRNSCVEPGCEWISDWG